MNPEYRAKLTEQIKELHDCNNEQLRNEIAKSHNYIETLQIRIAAAYILLDLRKDISSRLDVDNS